MSTARHLHFTYQEYLRSLEVSPLRLEFWGGEIVAMAGGSPTHAALSAAVIGLLMQHLKDGCRVYSSDLKIWIEDSLVATFPDAAVICGALRTAKIDPNAATNPSLLVEVTSPSTEDYDRGAKLAHYRRIPTLRAILFVSHRDRSLTAICRTTDGWVEREARAGEVLRLEDPPLSVAVDDVYAGIDLDPA